MPTIDEQLAKHEAAVIWQQRKSPLGGNDTAVKPGIQMGLRLLLGQGSQSSTAQRANAVRDHVQTIVRKRTEVMVKITGHNPDMAGFARSLDYVSRSGRYKHKAEESLELEDDAGQIYRGLQGREMLRRAWALGGPSVPEAVVLPPGVDRKKAPRQILKIIYSMPAHVGRESVTAAARAAITETFGRHQFVMAHHADTDNHHTHLLIKMVDMDGRRMNPRKADLQVWRDEFAKQLNLRGIEAAATRRRVRLKREKGVSQAVREMRARGVVPSRDRSAQTQPRAAQAARENDARMLGVYADIAQTLRASPDPLDRALADELVTTLKTQGHSLPVGIKPNAPRPSP
jgi:hypothetical protein